MTTLNQAIMDAQNAGIAVNAPNLESSIQDFEKLRIKAYMDNMREIQSEENVGLLLKKLSSTAYSQRTIDVIETFLKESKQFITNSLVRVQKDSAALPSFGELESRYEAIELGINSLKNLAATIKGDITSCL